MHVSTVLVRVAVGNTYFEGRPSKACFVLCPRLTLPVLLLRKLSTSYFVMRLRKTCSYPHINFPMRSTPLSASETAPSPTLK